MGSDGGNMGIGADRAMHAVIGGDQPTEDDQITREEMREKIMAHPHPKDLTEDIFSDKTYDYGSAAEVICRAILAAEEAEPGSLSQVSYFPDDYEHVYMRGVRRDVSSVISDIIEALWPEAYKALSGGSGFMWGWATNCARWILDLPPVANPALVEIGGGPSERIWPYKVRQNFATRGGHAVHHFADEHQTIAKFYPVSELDGYDTETVANHFAWSLNGNIVRHMMGWDKDDEPGDVSPIGDRIEPEAEKDPDDSELQRGTPYGDGTTHSANVVGPVGPADPLDGGEDAETTAADEAAAEPYGTCEACGEPIDYCQGHGPDEGDPLDPPDAA